MVFVTNNVDPLGRFKHENRAFDDMLIGDMKHNVNNTAEKVIWNYENQDPNAKVKQNLSVNVRPLVSQLITNKSNKIKFKVLMALDYALSECKNMKSVVFHADGIFPRYSEIFDHMVSEHFEGIKCLGPVKPVDSEELQLLRSIGPFARYWWRLDQLPPEYGKFC